MSGPFNIKGPRARAFALFSGLTGLIALALYPTVIYPYFHIDEYREIQKITRAGVNQEAVQPGGMKVWTDPFDRKK
ncbi:hypothetical protein JTE90_002234 [Oedothorax gibbosus]|uniref:Small integral membrane protein 20 n=1 Tax=Oedothorax gibbosus TaxID=931172 RepID=A0AAV6V7R9_9ARAC|nr:hypothetical protein JTE90_002234 [Oedothorax gibbosus]